MFDVLLKKAHEILDLKLGFPTRFKVGQNTVFTVPKSMNLSRLLIS